MSYDLHQTYHILKLKSMIMSRWIHFEITADLTQKKFLAQIRDFLISEVCEVLALVCGLCDVSQRFLKNLTLNFSEVINTKIWLGLYNLLR